MGILKVLFDAVRRIRARKQPAPKPAWTVMDLPPEDVEFFQELGLGPEDVEEPYAIPELGLAPAIPSATLEVIRGGVWMGVASSNVDSWRFDERAGVIEVRFLSGSSKWRYKSKATGKPLHSPKRPWPG